jgi:hypothetical protein
MDQQQHYRPTVAFVEKNGVDTSYGRVPLCTCEHPEHVCGIAKKIGYTGREITDRTLYRVKLFTERKLKPVTLPSLFVFDDGLFLELDQWETQHHPRS